MEPKTLGGQAAYDELTDTHKLTDEQARRMLRVARDYGLVNFPINDYTDFMSVKYQAEDRKFVLGDADFSDLKGKR